MSNSTTLATDLRVLDFYLVSEWIERKGSSCKENIRLVYISMQTAADIASGCGHNQNYERLCTVTDLSSPLVYLIVEKCPDFEHPFIMALNFPHNEALVLTVNEEQHRRPIQDSQWFSRLWNGVARIQRAACGSESPDITYIHWITVCFSQVMHSPLLNPIRKRRILAGNVSPFSTPFLIMNGISREMAFLKWFPLRFPAAP